MASHVVQQGECLASIAKQYGFRAWKTVWDHADNAELRASRNNPNVLYPGDVVAIPDKKQKEEPSATEKTHRFVVKRPEHWLRVQMLDDGKPIAGEPYALSVGGQTKKGVTDGDGWVVAPIPGDELRGVLVLENRNERYDLGIGHLDPPDTPTGAQSRLRQLGFYAGGVDGDIGEYSRGALLAFQRANGLDVTGDLDGPTHAALRRAYGC